MNAGAQVSEDAVADKQQVEQWPLVLCMCMEATAGCDVATPASLSSCLAGQQVAGRNREQAVLHTNFNGQRCGCLDQMMAGPIPWPEGPRSHVQTPPQSRQQLLDRYNQHTKHCKHCSQV